MKIDSTMAIESLALSASVLSSIELSAEQWLAMPKNNKFSMLQLHQDKLVFIPAESDVLTNLLMDLVVTTEEFENRNNNVVLDFVVNTPENDTRDMFDVVTDSLLSNVELEVWSIDSLSKVEVLNNATLANFLRNITLN